MSAASGARKAVRLSLTGVVQGVGFRPFVHRLAIQHGLTGWVRNESGAVQIEVEGLERELDEFVAALTANAPPLACIDSLEADRVDPTYATRFVIRESAEHSDRRQPVAPDVALCAACEAELWDSADRRFRYPFITCTDCGPRYTVIEAMPYDRERTSMRVFTQCDLCLREYSTPDDRRYHSESNSCPECGPTLWFERATDVGDRSSDGVAALEDARRLLKDGGVLAVKGLGGFHLAVDATNDAAVSRLRRRKSREARPLAVMVRTVEEAASLGYVGSVERTLLTSRERPIVLLRRREDCPLAPSVSPGLETVGVMTAYTPLHQLLLERVRRPLVMTSGNVSEEPIAIDNDEAREQLKAVADGFLLHDRAIVTRYDDSVVRVVDHAPIFLRRARGYAPLPLDLPVASPSPLVAVGPHLKNTFTLVHGARAYVSQHIGDLENVETLDHFRAALDAFGRLFHIEPEVAVCDLHPGYLSTRIAHELGLEIVLAVQHHHAHIAAVAAEHGIMDRVIGVAYDGTGMGDDGAVWGAEIMVADLLDYERVCQLRYAPLPGGDRAMRLPWRAACGYLSLESVHSRAFSLVFEGVTPRERTVAMQQIEHRLNAPMASSMGRLFDAAAAVLGVRTVSHYEGQAAMELEALAGTERADPLPFPLISDGDDRRVLDPMPLLVALGERRAAGERVGHLAARFHESVAAGTTEAVRAVGRATGIQMVVLSGGVFQNARLLSSLVARLGACGMEVLVPRKLSPNDGAISYGQAAIAAAALAGRSTASVPPTTTGVDNVSRNPGPHH